MIHFDKSIELAADYAPAWMGKAWAHHFLSEFNYGDIPDEVSLQRATPAALKALQLDPNLPEAHAIMGLIEPNGDELNPKVVAHFEKAIALNPNYADAYLWYANDLWETPLKAQQYLKKAVQLSPMSIIANNNYAMQLLTFGQLSEAADIAKHMKTINAKHQFPYAIYGHINTVKGEHAQAALLLRQAEQYGSSVMRLNFYAADALSFLGLDTAAGQYMEDSFLAPLKYWYSGNLELYVSQMRQSFPRNESDSLGFLQRAFAEATAGNYNEATKFFKQTDICETCANRIFSFQQSGDLDTAKMLLDKKKKYLKSFLSSGVKYTRYYSYMVPIEIEQFIVAYLEGDVERAVEYLKIALEKKFLFYLSIKNDPMYNKLHQHPDWLELLEESNERAKVQRELYLKLLEQQKSTAI